MSPLSYRPENQPQSEINIIERPKNQTAHVGDTVVFMCRSDTWPAPSVHWARKPANRLVVEIIQVGRLLPVNMLVVEIIQVDRLLLTNKLVVEIIQVRRLLPANMLVVEIIQVDRLLPTNKLVVEII